LLPYFGPSSNSAILAAAAQDHEVSVKGADIDPTNRDELQSFQIGDKNFSIEQIHRIIDQQSGKSIIIDKVILNAAETSRAIKEVGEISATAETPTAKPESDPLEEKLLDLEEETMEQPSDKIKKPLENLFYRHKVPGDSKVMGL
jgi:hypothetical protein